MLGFFLIEIWGEHVANKDVYTIHVMPYGFYHKIHHNIDGLVQERRNSSALAMELRLSCTNPLTFGLMIHAYALIFGPRKIWQK